jgi:putative membrane protein
VALWLLPALAVAAVAAAARRHPAALAPSRAASLLGGLLLLCLAGGLAPPGGLFSLRLLQDALLCFAAAPLCLLGTPAAWLRPLLRARPTLAAALRRLTRPLPAVALFHLAFALSLLPGALAGQRLGGGDLGLAAWRLVLFALALGMWSPLLSPVAELPRLPSGWQFAYLFVNWLAITAVFGWVTFDGGLRYGSGAGLLALGAAGDRQLGGFLLGLVSHLAYAVTGAALFWRWARSEAALASPQHLYRRARRAGFDDEEARRIAGLPRR